MGKNRCFLGIFASLFIALFVGNALAEGYSCPSYKKYTSCNEDYYMSGGQDVGNSCNPCGANSSSEGGTVSTCTCDNGYSVDGTANGATTTAGGSCTLISVTCAAGEYLPQNSKTCSKCPAGSYCGGGTFSFSSSVDQGKNPCPSGYTSNLGEATKDTGCYIMVDAGKYLTTKNTTTTAECAAGTFKAGHIVNYGSTSSCGVCGNNQYSDKGAASCSSCNSANGYVNSGTSATNHAGITSCKATCSAGTYVAEANAKCTSVGTGYWKESHTVSQGSTSMRNQCPAEYRDGAAVGAEADCVGIFEKTGKQVNGDVPANCASVTAWGTCTPTTCSYKKKYSGTITEDCTPKDCKKPVVSVTANSGYYDNGTTCPACSTVGDGSFKLSSAGNEGGNTKCYKNCTRACTQQSCPAHATCTHGSQTTSGTQYYNGTCSAAESTCTLSFTCNAGYVKNSSGTACEPAEYTVTYKNGGGVGADATQSVTYNAKFTTKAATLFTRPGYNFSSWGGSYPRASTDYTYTTVGNTVLTAQWSACSNNPTGAGTCNCPSNQYPNGSGCSACSVSCSSVSGFTLGTYNVCQSQTNSVCYRNCTTSDVSHSTDVSGTVTKGGTKTCAATACAENYYLSGSGCAACIPNATCPGDDEPFKCNPGYHLSDDESSCEPDEYSITLKKNGGTGTINGSTGTNDAVQKCKHGVMCSLPSAGLERTGYAFTGWGDSAGCTSGVFQKTFTGATTMYACWSQQTTQCQAGKYYDGENHVTCPAGMFCPGEGFANIGSAGCGTTCPGSGTSDQGATSQNQCYITCSGKTITGGKLTADSSKSNYNGSSYPACTYTANCNAGYAASNNGTAGATCTKCQDGVNCPGGTDDKEPEECPVGSYCEEGIAKECPAGGTSAAGAGSIEECYKTCAPTLEIENGQGISEGNAYYKGSSYPACQYRAECDENYTPKDSPSAAPSCVWADPDACPAGSYCPEDGSGPITCPGGGTSDAGATAVTQCYKTCSNKPITGGTANAVANKVNWTGSEYPVCTYNANCDEGYVASGNGTAGAMCTQCEDGVTCPGGTDEGEPEQCPAGSYCENGVEKACPEDGTSAAGSDSITDCYKVCPPTLEIDNGQGISTGNAFYSGSSYPACQYSAQCDENYTPKDSPSANPSCIWGDADECPAGYYCPPESPSPIVCPDGGTSEKGAVAVTQCYKVFDDYDGFQNGVASAKCFYQSSTSKYDACSILEVKSCIAGYWYAQQNAFLCSGTSTGFYSPEGAIVQTACPKDPVGGKVESSEYADSYEDCYKTCAIEVPHSTSVAAEQNTVYGISADSYAACSFAVTCETGYTVNGNNSESPSCAANEYTITLDKNGGTGSVAASIKCTFDSGACELPAVDGLTRPGYTVQAKWCADKNGSGPCYYAGQSTAANISANGTDTTLYAVWTPNVYEVTLDHRSADTDGEPATVYVKYATGWFTTEEANSSISKLTTVPTKSGYEFAGYYSATSGGTQVVSSDGIFQTSENALTFTTSPATIYARWSAGTTYCAPGTYYTGTGTQCDTCTANYYCPGGNFATDSGSPEGLNACPEQGVSTTGSSSVTSCYKTKLTYTASHGSGTQTCNYDDDQKSYSASCTDKVINSCEAGYYLANAEAESPDCDPVGNGYYSGGASTERTQCPNGGNTETETATIVQQCFKTGLAYEATYGSGTQRCFYSSGEGSLAVYQRDCDTKTINSCRGGYWLESPDDTDCVEVDLNYYSDSGDTERHACPASGKTNGTTSDSILLCYKDGLPYTEAEHGTGEYLCYYTSGDGDSAVYSSSCDLPTMTSCDAGYYYDHLLLPTDCMVAGIGYYSPALDTARHQCPMDGTTRTETSAAVSECYREDMACDIENGTGEQTCNYDESGKNYTSNCQTCNVTSCDEGYSQVGNTCINCPAGSVCDGGTQETCASLTDGLYPESDAGTTDVAMCYAECKLAANAAAMEGRDYYQGVDTCEIKRCQAGYTLDNGQCVECPEGSFCDGTVDPTDPGDDIKSCADLGNGEWSMSLPGAKDESGCYKKCEAYDVINGTAVPVSDKAFYPDDCEFEGQSDTGNPCDIIDGVCVEKSCNAGYEMKDGVCVPCDREYALSYKDGGVCQIAECVLGYHPEGDRCVGNIQECTAPNAVSAERTWDNEKNAFGSCMIKECEYGYHVASNACVSDVQPCNIENGSGFKEWNHDLNKWGECVATLCNPGYTNDPSETNEHTKQCGECKNKYSVLGKLAASSYVQGCEIASCMYQGELYNLEYNECVPICPTEEYEDETGTMVWDESRKKCVRTCKEGYTMW